MFNLTESIIPLNLRPLWCFNAIFYRTYCSELHNLQKVFLYFNTAAICHKRIFYPYVSQEKHFAFISTMTPTMFIGQSLYYHENFVRRKQKFNIFCTWRLRTLQKNAGYKYYFFCISRNIFITAWSLNELCHILHFIFRHIPHNCHDTDVRFRYNDGFRVESPPQRPKSKRCSFLVT